MPNNNRKIYFFIILFIYFLTILLFGHRASASENFLVDAKFEYKLDESGKCAVTNILSIKNITSDFYSKSYILRLNSLNPKAIKVFESGNQLKFEEENINDNTNIKIDFKEKIIGKGQTRTFVIIYEEENFASKTGEVWEIAIPRIEHENTFDSLKVTLSVPDDFGSEAYVSPQPLNKDLVRGRKIYTFDKDSLGQSGITVGFGLFQVFSFSLNYHLENPLRVQTESEITLPPDTSTQKVFYQNIEPRPNNVIADADGNWLAKYTLKPRQRLDIKAIGSVQIFSQPTKYLTSSVSDLSVNTLPAEYWESKDPQITYLAQKLKTPENIYNFVTNSLAYDFDRAKPNVERLGARTALGNSANAICMEFTDLFIALARAAGIPAREINGFAYTENPEVQPLSLVADVLHAWPEYFSHEKNTWIPIDPTWESTSGIDYFNKLDLRHFAFVIHGEDPIKPYPPGSYKLGPNPQKDVHVSFGTLPTDRNSDLKILFSYDKGLSLFSRKVTIKIKNEGSSASYNVTPEVLLDGQTVLSNNVSVMPPYSEILLKTKIDYGLLARQAPSSIKVYAKKTKIDVPVNKNQVVTYQVTSFFLFLLSILFFVQTRIRKSK
jgi:hypothetical protein